MRWLDRLERRWGAWTIPQFPLFIVAANAAIYFLAQIEPAFYDRLLLDPAVRAGQWWRLLTFSFVPPSMNILFMAFWLYLLYIYSQALETAWGEFRFCFFYAVGVAATILASLAFNVPLFSNLPLYIVIFLAFATLFPDFELLLFFILPVKIKYLAWLTWLWVGWGFIAGSIADRVGIGASLFNYFLFFGGDLWQSLKLKWQLYRNRRRW